MRRKAARKPARRPTKTIAIAAAAVAIVALAIVVLRGRGTAEPKGATRLDWPAGKEQVYALAWHTSTETTGAAPGAGEGAQGLRSLVEVEGELVLSSYGRKGEGFLLTARFEHLTKVTVRALDQSLLPSLETGRAELEGHTAELTMTPSGDVTDVRFHAKDPALFRYLMQAVLTELAVDVRDGTSWQASIDGPSGRGPVRFARDAEKPWVVTRTRERYDALAAWPTTNEPLTQTLQSSGSVALDPSGAIAELHDDESLEAARPRAQGKDVTSKTSFSLTKKLDRAFDASAPPANLDTPVLAEADAANETPEQHRARLEARTEGVTLETVVGDIRIHSAVPKGQSGRWAWIAQGWLELHPEQCDALVDQFPKLDAAGKSYSIDLLVMVGHEQAQAAAVRAFREKLVAPGPEYALMIQTLQQLHKPTLATAQFVADQSEAAKKRGDAPARYASAVALGGVVSHLAETDRIAARKLDDALVLDLYAAKEPRDREVLVMALGNAALEEDALAIRLAAHDTSPKVRTAVAGALRRFDGPDVRRTLLEAFRDPEDAVQREALGSLDRKDLGPAELGDMLDAVRRGKVRSGNVQALANFIARHRDAGPEIDQMLEALMSRDDLDGETMGRLERIRSRGR